MEDALSFADYIQGDAHGDFRLGADTKSWTRRKLVLMRELRGMPDEGEAWAKNFASTVSFTGSRDEFLDRLVGYMLRHAGLRHWGVQKVFPRTSDSAGAWASGPCDP